MRLKMPYWLAPFQKICFHSIATEGGIKRSSFTGVLLSDKERYKKEIAHGVFHMEPSISQPLDPTLYFHQEQWIQEQELLKKRLVLKDDFSWKIHPVLPSNGESGGGNILRYIGGVDLSFSKDDSSIACGALVVVDLDTLCVVYEDFDIVHLTMPYVPGFLAFRECPVLLGLLEKMKRAFHPFYPQLLMVDGNGILHPRGFGLASHLGVLSDLPSIGIGKNLHHVDGLTHEQVKRHLPKNTNKDGDAMPLIGKSGRTWGVAFRYNEQSSKPIFISIGHRISLETSIAIVRMCCKYRVPEPIRQADKRSKEYLQKKHEDLRIP